MDNFNVALIRTLSNDDFMELFSFMCEERINRETKMRNNAKREIKELLDKVDDLCIKYNFDLGYDGVLNDNDNVDPLDIFIR